MRRPKAGANIGGAARGQFEQRDGGGRGGGAWGLGLLGAGVQLPLLAVSSNVPRPACCMPRPPPPNPRAQVTLSSQVAHEHLVQLLDVFAQGKIQLVIVVRVCTRLHACVRAQPPTPLPPKNPPTHETPIPHPPSPPTHRTPTPPPPPVGAGGGPRPAGAAQPRGGAGALRGLGVAAG